jgi:hypothetical protein
MFLLFFIYFKIFLQYDPAFLIPQKEKKSKKEKEKF